jgi:hypothetical protein
LCARFIAWHTRFDKTLFQHGEMGLHLLIGALVDVSTPKQGSEPNPYVNPELLEHHETKGSITRFTASTIRRQ